MARSVFVDTGYLVALLDPRDRLDARALEVAQALAADDAALLTTDAVVLEVANHFARGPLRRTAARWIQALRAAEGWEVVPVDRASLLRAEERYFRHGANNWSLTDCHSMEHMRARKLREVATADAGFEAAGSFRRCASR